MIVGIDEVGRGPWAGPLVVGAVILGEATIKGLTDSKKLSKARREQLTKIIIERAADFGIGWVESTEIDEIGLSAALTIATKRALEQITVPYHEIIIDGTVNFLKDTNKASYVTTMKKADLLIESVSAASILAKVARDDYMAELGEQYPEYGFESHVGYGTARHSQAIEKHGVLNEHRRSFAPIKSLIGISQERMVPANGSNQYVGDISSDAATRWLQKQGYTIVDHNWRTRFCEVDIIASKNDTVFFVAVANKNTNDEGGAITAVILRKLRQMSFSAALYSVKPTVTNVRLAVIVTTGSNDIEIEEFLFI